MSHLVNGPVRVAIIGCGGISHAHGVGYLAHADAIRVTALCDIDPQAVRKRDAQLGGGCRHFADWTAMFREAGDRFDAVDVCLPHHLHGPAIRAAAAAGKHVLCEKPMCTTTAEADAIAAAVAASGISYMSAHNQLFMPVVAEAKRMIDAGDLGAVRFIRSQDCFDASQRTRAQWGWRANLDTQGGGELVDTGYHPVYRLLYLAVSPVAAVRGTFARFRCDLDGEDTASVQVRFASGCIGEVFTSWAMPLAFGTHQVHVVGEAGQLFGSENTLYHLPAGATEPKRRDFPAVDTMAAEIAHFANCLRTGRRPIHSVAEGRAVLDVILSAAASADGWQRAAANGG